MKVQNMTSKTGKAVANQFIITDDNGSTFFQSYKSTIAFIPYSYSPLKPVEDRMPNEKIILDETTWDYSTTTGKYRNEFLGEGIADTRKKIKSGEYILTDLN